VKITEIAQTMGLLFSIVKVVYYFSQKGLGYILGKFFHKRIWSHSTGKIDSRRLKLLSLRRSKAADSPGAFDFKNDVFRSTPSAPEQRK
jgi:hypothetical protein